MIFRKANILNEHSQGFNGKTIIGVKDLSRIDSSVLLSVCMHTLMYMLSGCHQVV